MSDPHLYRVEFYVSDRGESFIDEMLDRIPDKHRGKVLQWMKQLEIWGPRLPRPYADVLDKGIRELRVRFGHHNYRFFYFITDKTVVMTHGILKKTGPVPREEIDRAARLKAQWIQQRQRRN